ncbi:hypothetical protein GCM10023238_14250 [Streptomyces heliomycini]
MGCGFRRFYYFSRPPPRLKPRPIEDSRFYEHGAVDLKGVLRALNKNARSGEVSEGASTLTQQYVKNVFVEEAGDDPTKVAQATQQTIGRKIAELKYAIQGEEELGKRRSSRTT